MQVFILGKTKAGKSTLAKYVQSFGFDVYEAGAWTREEFLAVTSNQVFDEMSIDYKEKLTAFALSKLAQNPYYSFEKYEQFKKHHLDTNLVIVGVRNPDDFINMLRMDKDNRVIFVKSNRKHGDVLVQFESGLDVIEQYLEWRKANANPIPVLDVDDFSVVPNLDDFLKELV